MGFFCVGCDAIFYYDEGDREFYKHEFVNGTGKLSGKIVIEENVRMTYREFKKRCEEIAF